MSQRPQARPFEHVHAPRAELYRYIMRSFAEAKHRFLVHLRPEDLREWLAPTDHNQHEDTTVLGALDQLVEWGNLRADPDTSRVVTVEDFYRARYLYQLTPEGEAAEIALAAYDQALGRRGELQSVALEDIRVRVRSLLYRELFTSSKQCMGVVKQIKASPVMALFGRALRPGEIFVVETLADHLEKSQAPNANAGEGGRPSVQDPLFLDQVAARVLRGLFKPRKKAFAFEVHEKDLEVMLRILAADSQLNYAGHEIPYLLNRVDEEVRSRMSQRVLRDRTGVKMATSSEELFFDELHERSFR